MQNSYQALAKILSFDPGRRRIPALACPVTLSAAAQALGKARRVVLCSGFYIGRAAAWETDGPLGTLALAAALQDAGIEPVIFTDEGALAIFAAGMQVLGLDTPLRGFPAAAAPSPDCLLQEQADVIVAIERNGQARDGKYYNAEGTDVSEHVAHFDALFATAVSHKITSIAIGDGGNELGFGTYLTQVRQLLGAAQPIACVTSAQYVIACGVSNWGGYALAASVSKLKGRPMPLNQEVLTNVLQAIVAAGAIDGVSGLQQASIDGLPWEVELEIFSQITEVLPHQPTRIVSNGN